MMPLQLFLQAFKIVYRNLREALIISGVPFAILLVVGLLIGTTTATPQVGTTPSGGMFSGVFAFAILMVLVFGYIAASWHRYVLLEEQPRLLGSPAMGRALPYIGNSILLGLWLSLFLFPVMIVIGFLLVPLLGGGGSIGTGAPNYGLDDVAFEIFIGTGVSTLALMYSMVLPASALEKRMTFKESRYATMRFGIVNLALVALCVVAFNTVANYLLIYQLAGTEGFVSTVLSLAIQWLVMMIGISILTTLYGHLVEGRDLPS